MTRVLCKPCYDAIRTAVLAREGVGLKDISIETAARFATDLKYACDRRGAFASHRCLSGDCVCACHALRPAGA